MFRPDHLPTDLLVQLYTFLSSPHQSIFFHTTCSSTLKRKAAYSFETSIYAYKTIRCHIPEYYFSVQIHYLGVFTFSFIYSLILTLHITSWCYLALDWAGKTSRKNGCRGDLNKQPKYKPRATKISCAARYRATAHATHICTKKVQHRHHRVTDRRSGSTAICCSSLYDVFVNTALYIIGVTYAPKNCLTASYFYIPLNQFNP